MSAIASERQVSSRYGAVQLFDLNQKRIWWCLSRLNYQASLYKRASAAARRRMAVRALYVTSFTLNATAIWTAKLLERGGFSMRTQRLFFRSRWRKDPSEWGETPKGCFARALAGFSVGRDGVCIDRHLERLEISPADAPEQWRVWFRAYESMYGQGEAAGCIDWHVRALDWIAGRAPRPVPWR